MKVKWGALIVDGRGKIGGQVASKNRSGSYMRNKVTPANPNSIAQVAVRNMLGTASSAWSGLTAVQRSGWNTAAKDWASTNIFGDGVEPTGKNLFAKLNINLMNIGESMINDVPVKSSVPALSLTEAIYDVSSLSITITNALAVPGYMYLISATANQTAGTSFFKGKFRNITYNSFPASVGGDVWFAYQLRFGDVPADPNIQFEVKLVNMATGQTGLPVTIPVVVVP